MSLFHKQNLWKWTLVFFLAGFVGSFAAGQKYGASRSASRGYCVREKGRHYQFINPLLGCEISTAEFSELQPIKTKVEQLIAGYQKDKVLSASVYFRLLNSGRWFEINADKKYSPASLLKIPIMMAYFKQAESFPALLSQTLKYDGTFDQTEFPVLSPEKHLVAGKIYTVEELIERMVKYSSNAAVYLLHNALDEEVFKSVYGDLGIRSPFVENGDFMSVKDYAFFYRILYNTSYLNREFSEKALEISTQTDFDEGLTAKLPREMRVAHKFGSSLHDGVNPVEGELHDCGIVYFPDHPYLLCVMTASLSSDGSKHLIADISQTVNQAVADFFRKQE